VLYFFRFGFLVLGFVDLGFLLLVLWLRKHSRHLRSIESLALAQRCLGLRNSHHCLLLGLGISLLLFLDLLLLGQLRLLMCTDLSSSCVFVCHLLELSLHSCVLLDSRINDLLSPVEDPFNDEEEFLLAIQATEHP